MIHTSLCHTYAMIRTPLCYEVLDIVLYIYSRVRHLDIIFILREYLLHCHSRDYCAYFINFLTMLYILGIITLFTCVRVQEAKDGESDEWILSAIEILNGVNMSRAKTNVLHSLILSVKKCKHFMLFLQLCVRHRMNLIGKQSLEKLMCISILYITFLVLQVSKYRISEGKRFTIKFGNIIIVI